MARLLRSLVLAAVLAAACGGKRADDRAYALGTRGCLPPEETARALLAGWDPALRAALETDRPGGVAVVRFDGCELELLDDCILEGEYAGREAPRSRHSSVIRSPAELATRLPFGARALAGELPEGAALSLDYVIVSAEDARLRSSARGMLRGRCDRATHFVRSKVRGAFELRALPPEGTGAAARVVDGGGELGRCGGAAAPAGSMACRAVVQVTLTPIFELTSDRGDLYDDLGRDVVAIAEVEEALRSLQALGGREGASPPAPERAPGAAPPVTGGEGASLPGRILALPGGGSDAWDAIVAPLLVSAFDADGSSRIDTAAEVAAIPCEVLAALDAAIRGGRGPASSLRTTYGFPGGYLWIGGVLGLDEKVRSAADARLVGCGL